MSFDAIVASARPAIALALVRRINLLDSLLKTTLRPCSGRRHLLLQKNAAVGRLLVLGMGTAAPADHAKPGLVSIVPNVGTSARAFRVPFAALPPAAQDVVRRALSIDDLADCA